MICDHYCKILEIKKKEYNRYIKPFHKEEQTKRDLLLKQLPMFQSLSVEQAHNLMGGMRVLRFMIGDKIITEGKYNHWLLFLVKGHVQATKRVSQVKVDNSTDLPNPLEGYAKVAKKSAFMKEVCLASHLPTLLCFALYGRRLCLYAMPAAFSHLGRALAGCCCRPRRAVPGSIDRS